MRLKMRLVRGAYVGRDCEVVGPLGDRVYPPPPYRKYRAPDGVSIDLGANRDACVGFLAGYEFATKRANGS